MIVVIDIIIITIFVLVVVLVLILGLFLDILNLPTFFDGIAGIAEIVSPTTR